MKGLRLKKPKEMPITHNLGRLVTFFCKKCGTQLVACYETDPLRGGGISRDWRSCGKCGNPLDFGEYYHRDTADDEIQFED